MSKQKRSDDARIARMRPFLPPQFAHLPLESYP